MNCSALRAFKVATCILHLEDYQHFNIIIIIIADTHMWERLYKDSSCNVPSLHAMHLGFVTPIGLSISFRYSEGAKSQRINSCRPLIPTPQALPHYLGTTGYSSRRGLSVDTASFPLLLTVPRKALPAGV